MDAGGTEPYTKDEPVPRTQKGEMNMNIGDKIRALRKTRKLTQEQLAEYLNISAQAVSKWETGLSGPDIDMLPRLAVFFGVTVDELLDFDRHRIDREVDALVAESLPLREDPKRAEAFYRKALEKYPNNEVLLNCLLMVIPGHRAEEKIRIGERLLDCTADDEIRHDVCRLLAETCHAIGENAMAEHYLTKLPEIYFLKTEVAASIRTGEPQLTEIRKTENVCFRILAEMLALRMRREGREPYQALARDLLTLYGTIDGDHADHAEKLAAMLEDGSILEF